MPDEVLMAMVAGFLCGLIVGIWLEGRSCDRHTKAMEEILGGEKDHADRPAKEKSGD